MLCKDADPNCVRVSGRKRVPSEDPCAGCSSSHKHLNVTTDARTTDIFFTMLTLLVDQVPVFSLFSFYSVILLVLRQGVRFYFVG